MKRYLSLILAIAATVSAQIVPSTGNVRGPTSATDNAVARYDGTTGKLIQNSGVTIDDSGNLTVSGTTIGLGVTPSAWDGTLVKAFQLADNGASLSSFSTGNTSNKLAILSNNAYYDSGGWKYLQTAGTAQYRIANEEHLWYSAASGTAGNAITFTERMKLDSSGNLTVFGGTVTSGTGTLTLNSSANTVVLQSAGTTALTLDSSQNAYGSSDNTYFSWDANSNRIGITKKSGSIGKFTYGSASSFTISQSSGTTIQASNTFTDRFTIDSSGDATFAGSIAIGNTVNTVSPTSPNRTITMVIGGTTYYIHAKTTND